MLGLRWVQREEEYSFFPVGTHHLTMVGVGAGRFTTVRLKGQFYGSRKDRK